MSDLESYSDSWEAERRDPRQRGPQEGNRLLSKDAPPVKKRVPNKSPQQVIDDFWAKFNTKYSGKGELNLDVTSPDNIVLTSHHP